MSEKATLSLDNVLFTATRVSIGWVFLFAFIDKAFGLAFYWQDEKVGGTDVEASWFAGGSPTRGFLFFGTDGKWLQDVFQSLAGTSPGPGIPPGGNPLVDALFMIGLLGVGLAFILGIGRKIAAVSGSLILVLMWLASLPLEHNPFMDDHLIYAFVMLIHGFTAHTGIIFVPQWKSIAERYPFLA